MPLDVSRIPDELWLEILSYFCFDGIAKVDHIVCDQVFDRDTHDIITLQAIRGVCRGLQRLVDPLLCPGLHVAVNSESLHRIERLTRNPRIARGVRIIEIDLRYRPAYLATDILTYDSLVHEVLNIAQETCEAQTLWRHYDAEDLSPGAMQHRAFEAADHTLNLIGDAWDRCLRPERDFSSGRPEREDFDEQTYLTIIRESFESYASLHEDQKRIISDGSFVASLAEIISRFPRRVQISFTAEQRRPLGILKQFIIEESLAMTTDHSVLRKHLVAAQDWAELEALSEEREEVARRLDDADNVDADAREHPRPENKKKSKPKDDLSDVFLPVRILSDLPIACAHLPLPLRSLEYAVFPTWRGFRPLLPASSWDRLRSACRHLESVDFAPRTLGCEDPLRYRWAAPEPGGRPDDGYWARVDERVPGPTRGDHEICADYLAAVCSGPALRGLTLHVSRCWKGGSAEERVCLVDRVARGLTTDGLARLVVREVEVFGDGLRELLSRVGGGEVGVSRVELGSVRLVEGYYAEAMEVLRGRLGSSRICEGAEDERWTDRTVSFESLEGGEFGLPTEPYYFRSKKEDRERRQHVQQVMEYVCGERDVDEIIPPSRTLRG